MKNVRFILKEGKKILDDKKYITIAALKVKYKLYCSVKQGLKLWKHLDLAAK